MLPAKWTDENFVFSDMRIVGVSYYDVTNNSQAICRDKQLLNKCLITTVYQECPHKFSFKIFKHQHSAAVCVMYDRLFQQRMDQPGMVANPVRGQLNREI